MSDLAPTEDSPGKGTASIEKALTLMLSLVEEEGRLPASRLAEKLGLPPSSARRMIGALSDAGVITRISHGHYAAGPALERISEYSGTRARLIRIAQVPLRRLAQGTGATAHLGVLEGEMVTYLARESADPNFSASQIGAQFEPYCTGIGKILLAGLPSEAREAFFASGPFVPLTANTLTDPLLLRAEVEKSAGQGYAIDEAEMFENVRCIAAPIQREGRTIAAVSLSRLGGPVPSSRRARDLARLTVCVDDISKVLG